MKRIFLASTFVVVLTVSSLLLARTWTDRSGSFSVEAELVEYADGIAVLKKEDGTVIRVPLNKLSFDDQKWLREELKRRRAADTETTGGQVAAENSSSSDTGDWPRWRGPKNDGISPETDLLESWPEEGPPVDWSVRGLGDGFSSVSIANGKIYTMGRKDGATQLVCRSAEDGSELWMTRVGGGDRPNCTPTVDVEANLVFGLSHGGDLLCANATSGEEVWRKSYKDDFGGRMMSGWGYSESPLVDGDALICTPGGDKAVVVALNKKTGELLWAAQQGGLGGAGYASPIISNGAGVKQYLTLTGRGLIGVAAENGQVLWHYDRIANGTANIPTPIVKGDFVFASTGYGDGGSGLIKLARNGRGVGFQQIYYKKADELQNHHGGMVMLGDYIYMGHGHNNGFPVCIDAATGRAVWGPERGAGGNSAALVAADGHLYFRYQNGIMALVEATPKGYNLKGKFRIKSVNGESWPHPVIAHGKLYLRDQDELHCYDIAAK